MSKRLHMFEAYGIELEYMIVDRDTLQVKPIADQLLKDASGDYSGDYENGLVTWSNELVLHVIELKCTKPEADLQALESAFAENVKEINQRLVRWNAMLLPSAAHPLMNPHTETRLCPHTNNEVYDIYNQIFDCRGHGWANLQSTHLNLPFANDREFEQLHAAVRIILPLLPALCASSPLLDGAATGYADARLTFYKSNQSKIPSITGAIIPEPVFSEREHHEVILKKIEQDIAPYNKGEILDPVWVNSRGAMSRFDRGSIEIRIMDIQECPRADIAIVTLVVEVLKQMVNETFASLAHQKLANTDWLAALLQQTIANGGATAIADPNYLGYFNLNESQTALGIWKHLAGQLLAAGNDSLARVKEPLNIILERGNLSERMMHKLGSRPDAASIVSLFRELGSCLHADRLFT